MIGLGPDIFEKCCSRVQLSSIKTNWVITNRTHLGGVSFIVWLDWMNSYFHNNKNRTDDSQEFHMQIPLNNSPSYTHVYEEYIYFFMKTYYILSNKLSRVCGLQVALTKKTQEKSRNPIKDQPTNLSNMYYSTSGRGFKTVWLQWIAVMSLLVALWVQFWQNKSNNILKPTLKTMH